MGRMIVVAVIQREHAWNDALHNKGEILIAQGIEKTLKDLISKLNLQQIWNESLIQYQKV
jgi:hypothetical protein